MSDDTATDKSKRIENRGENLVDMTNDYNENERPLEETESVLDETVDKVKAGSKAVINKVKDTDRDLGTEYREEKAKEDLK